jgi:hypothetical protein
VVDDPVHLLALGRQGGLAATPLPRRLRVAEPVPGCVQLRVLPERSAELVRRDVVDVELVRQDRELPVPDLVASLVVRRTGVPRVERLHPLVGTEPDVAPGSLHLHPLDGRLLAETDGRLDGLHHVRGRLQARHLGVGLVRGGATLGHELSQDAGLHALLPQAGEHVGHVRQVGLVRTNSTPPRR